MKHKDLVSILKTYFPTSLVSHCWWSTYQGLSRLFSVVFIQILFTFIYFTVSHIIYYIMFTYLNIYEKMYFLPIGRQKKRKKKTPNIATNL